jgi:hypothetical protein
MKFLALALASLLIISSASADTVNQYAVAHTRTRNADMVVIKIHPRFFDAPEKTQAIWYTDIQACVRASKLAGTVVLVTGANGRFRYYGPKSWHEFLKTINLAWVNARVNKQLTCRF